MLEDAGRGWRMCPATGVGVQCIHGSGHPCSGFARSLSTPPAHTGSVKHPKIWLMTPGPHVESSEGQPLGSLCRYMHSPFLLAVVPQGFTPLPEPYPWPCVAVGSDVKRAGGCVLKSEAQTSQNSLLVPTDPATRFSQAIASRHPCLPPIPSRLQSRSQL